DRVCGLSAASGAGRTAAVLSLIAATGLIFGSSITTVSAQPDCKTIEDFSKAKVGELPADWKLRKDSAKDAYRVAEEARQGFLGGMVKVLGVQAAEESEWDLAAYPMLVWSGRPLEFPNGSDERDSKTNDSALAVYMLVPYSRVRGPRAVKYIWSEKVPVGT